MKYVIRVVCVLLLVSCGLFMYFYVQDKKETERLKEEEKRLEEIRLENEREVLRSQLLLEAEELFKGYYVDEAISLLEKDNSLINDVIQNKIDEYKEYKDSYVLYEGTVHHIFFHSLILYPEYLFRNINVPTGGYNEGFSYKRELERMLPLLLENGFVLYNIKDIYEKDETGKMVRKDIYLPKGKKPLILSVDDPALTYGVGFADQMIVDEDGNLATKVKTPDGETITTYDGDVELVVNNFIKEHPEFSYKGARGIIATTGWEGFFGHELDTEESKNEAKKVADKLKEEGWLFASHSYTHNRNYYFGPNSNAYNIKSDTSRWKAKMEPIIGKTNIFIAPFGYRLKGAGLQVILDNGFDIYCTVASVSYEELYDDYALMSRIEMGGYAYEKYTKYINNNLFDVSKVRDSYRPPVLSN